MYSMHYSYYDSDIHHGEEKWATPFLMDSPSAIEPISNSVDSNSCSIDLAPFSTSPAADSLASNPIWPEHQSIQTLLGEMKNSVL